MLGKLLDVIRQCDFKPPDSQSVEVHSLGGMLVSKALDSGGTSTEVWRGDGLLAGVGGGQPFWLGPLEKHDWERDVTLPRSRSPHVQPASHPLALVLTNAAGIF